MKVVYPSLSLDETYAMELSVTYGCPELPGSMVDVGSICILFLIFPMSSVTAIRQLSRSSAYIESWDMIFMLQGMPCTTPEQNTFSPECMLYPSILLVMPLKQYRISFSSSKKDELISGIEFSSRFQCRLPDLSMVRESNRSITIVSMLLSLELTLPLSAYAAMHTNPRTDSMAFLRIVRCLMVSLCQLQR